VTFIVYWQKIMRSKFLLLNPFIAFNKDVQIGENQVTNSFVFLSLCGLHP